MSLTCEIHETLLDDNYGCDKCEKLDRIYLVCSICGVSNYKSPCCSLSKVEKMRSIDNKYYLMILDRIKGKKEYDEKQSTLDACIPKVPIKCIIIEDESKILTKSVLLEKQMAELGWTQFSFRYWTSKETLWSINHFSCDQFEYTERGRVMNIGQMLNKVVNGQYKHNINLDSEYVFDNIYLSPSSYIINPTSSRRYQGVKIVTKLLKAGLGVHDDD